VQQEQRVVAGSAILNFGREADGTFVVTEFDRDNDL